MLTVALAKQRGSFRLDVRFDSPIPGVVALFGPSGCGKTTAVNLIAGLLSPDRGRVALGDTVLFDGESRIDVPAERRGIGYVFQDSRLFPHLSVAGNLKFAERRDPCTDVRTGFPAPSLDRHSELRNPQQRPRR